MGNMTSNRWERVKELFAAAAHMTPPERSSFLPSACDGDGVVLAEVERLLQQHDRMGDFLESGDESDCLAQLLDLHTFDTGDLVSGRFRIVRFIGRGGMGEVYEAEDEELGRRIALKTIRPEIAADERIIVRFMQEIQLSLKVTHSNVCRIYDIGHEKRASSTVGTEETVTYLTMELLPGDSLAERLRRCGRMTTEEALPIVLQIISGLEAAHDTGIVHGDLKSSNVVLAPAEDGRVRAVVTDFGLARLSSMVGQSETYHHAGGTGTPAYMAPEQVECGTVTTAADIYSLGIVMFEMVTGRLPFLADTPTLMANKRLQENAPVPRSIVSDLDRKWDRVILKCLERDPQSRFRMATDVAHALHRGHRLRLPYRRRKLVLSVCTCVLLVPLSLVGYRLWHASRPERKAELAQARISEGLAREDSGDATQAEALFEQARRLYAAIGNRAGIAEALTREADLFTDQENFGRADNAYQSALTVAREIDDQQRIGIVLLNWGIDLHRQGDDAGARKNYVSALEIFMKIGDKRRAATVLKDMGNLGTEAAESQRDYEQALMIFKEIGYKRGAASTLDDLGAVLDQQGYLAGARKVFEEELSMWQEIGDQAYEGYAGGGAFNLGYILYEQGHLSAGKQQFEYSLQVARKVAPFNLPEILSNLGDLVLQEGQLGEAGKAAEEALALGYKSGNKGEVGDARLLLAKIALEENRTSEAESQARQAGDQFRIQKLFVYEGRSSAVLALALVAQRKFRDAKNTIRTQVLPAMKNLPINGDRISFLITAGRVLAATGDIPAGVRYLKSGLADSSRLGYLGHELEAGMALGEVDMKSGNTDLGRTRLTALEKEARANGYQLIASKSRQAMQIAIPQVPQLR